MDASAPMNESELLSTAEALRGAVERAERGLVGRRALVELIVLATVAGEHLLIIGEPGTAKSAAVRAVAAELGGETFEYLLSRFTEPTELFGSLDIAKLREGKVEVRTEGMLPQAEFAFLDEVFLGSTAILNQLLTLLNERVFRQGHTRITVPLRTCVGASNALPEDTTLAAFADRFLLRHFVEPVPDASLESLLAAGWGGRATPQPIERQGLDALREMLPHVDLNAARPLLADAARALRNAGIVLSDRRLVRIQRLVAAAALLDGRSVATEADLWPVHFAVPTEDGQRASRELLREVLDASASQTLRAAAEAAAASPSARAARLAAAARALLEVDVSMPARRRLSKLEAAAREIDANFETATLPPDLAEARAALVAEIDAMMQTPAAHLLDGPPP